MAIERVARVPPHVALMNEIDSRRTSPAVMFSGLAPVLDMLRAYIVGTVARLDALEKQVKQLQGVDGMSDYFARHLER